MRCRKSYASEEKYRAAKKRASQRYRDRNGGHMYRDHWDDDDYLAVMRHDMPDSELSPLIGHSVSAIQSARRRVRRGEVAVAGYDPSMDALSGLSKYGAGPDEGAGETENEDTTTEKET